MKTSLSKDYFEQPSGSGAVNAPRIACESLLWIGDTEHSAVAQPWRACQRLCDAISIRRSISEALTSPPRHVPTHMVIAQTNRHERGRWAIDGPEMEALRDQFAQVKTLVLRGPLVAPTVRLPAQAHTQLPPGTPTWVDSIPVSEAVTFLEYWCGASEVDHRSEVRPAPILLPIMVVAARYEYAESLIDSLPLLFSGRDVPEPLVQWQRDLTPRSGRGFATVVWDESVATPETTQHWPQRCGRAAHARHVWMTGMATPQQRLRALNAGVHQVLDKPGRLECLAASVRAA